jgi:hypothetical protein
MRFAFIAAVSVLALAACNKAADTAAAPAAPAAPDAAPAAPMASAMASGDASHAMDAASMAAAAEADAGPLQLTPDNHMFHVMQGTKEEKVVLPAGGVWTPDKPSTDNYSFKDSQKAKLADGADVEVFTFEMLKPSTSTVVFTKTATGKPSDKAEDTRTVMFMIH